MKEITTEQIEGNRLIAEFMRLELSTNGKEAVIVTNAFGLGTKTNHTLAYHSSWDWLMPVVFKVRDIELRAKKLSAVCFAFTSYKTMSIDSVWRAVVHFIHWHNEHLALNASQKENHDTHSPQ